MGLPTRWARSVACASTAAFHHGSKRMTVSARKIQADAASFQTNHEDGNRGIALEVIHEFLALFGRAIEIQNPIFKLLEAFANQV